MSMKNKIKKLTLQQITTFEQAELNFSQGINIIIGENSTGKSHLLKMAYTITSSWNQFGKEGWREFLINKLATNLRRDIQQFQWVRNNSDSPLAGQW